MADLLPPNSMVRRVNAEPVVMFGAGRDLLLQVAHTAVAQAVADHDNFPNDMLRRLRGTFDAMYGVVFGSESTAAAIGEAWIGAGRGVQDLVYFAVGDHTTGGIVRRGTPVTGTRGRAASVAWPAHTLGRDGSVRPWSATTSPSRLSPSQHRIPRRGRSHCGRSTRDSGPTAASKSIGDHRGVARRPRWGFTRTSAAGLSAAASRSASVAPMSNPTTTTFPCRLAASTNAVRAALR